MRPDTASLESIYLECRQNTAGMPADYINALATADASQFGMALTMVSSGEFCFGDVDVPFSIQSISKVFMLLIAYEAFGADEVHKHVGSEPSGEAYNSIELKPDGQPYNPLINAGAITVAGLLYDAFGDSAFDLVLDDFGRYAGSEAKLDSVVFREESSSGYRNLAIAYLLKQTGVIKGEVEPVVRLYTHACSVQVTARMLSIMAATIANHGINPITRERLCSAINAQHAGTIMLLCGMYDAAGTWAADVGVPAKSGVSGGLIASVHKRFGVGFYSPPIDKHGNSIRAMQACSRLDDLFNIHVLEL